MNINPQKVFFLNNHISSNINNTINNKLELVANNIGNAYIAYSIHHILFGKIIQNMNGIGNIFDTCLENYDTENINNNYDYVIINMQDQLRKDISYYGNTDEKFKKINIFLNKIKIQIICFGLGSNCFNSNNFNNIIDELYESQLEFIKIISLKSKFFSIRGKYTKIIMDNLNIKNYVMVGCPSFFINNTKKIIIKENIKKIVITGYKDFVYNYNENKKLLGFLNLSNFELFFFCQDMYEIDILDKEKINDINIVFLTDYDEINNFFKDKDLVIGTRIHASIIALNNGIPAICTNNDSRALEMCELFKIPHINFIKNLENKNIYEILNSINFEEINDNFNIIKKEHDMFLTKIFE